MMFKIQPEAFKVNLFGYVISTILILLLFECKLVAQNVSDNRIINISGFVIDRYSGEPLVGCNILSNTSTFIGQTNNFGFFSFKWGREFSEIVFTYVGYTDLLISVDSLVFQDKVRILMNPGHELKTVEIAAKQDMGIQFGQLNLPIERLMDIPVLGGEPDIFKSLSLLPGVSNGLEGTSGLLVRGGAPDQNLVLLDDAVVYNTSLLFGLVTIFNPLALKSVNLLKGNFPARYGGRLSSVVDITMKDGSNIDYGGDFTVGLINSSFLLEGPVKKNESSFLFAGRATYSGLLTSLLSPIFSPESKIDFLVYDVNIKYNFSVNDRNRIFISAFRGQNTFGNSTSDSFGQSSFSQTSQNNTATIRHYFSSKNGSFLTNIIALNSYNSGIRSQFFSTSTDEQITHTNRNFVSDCTIKSKLDLPPYVNHMIRAGFETIFKSIIPSRVERENKSESGTNLVRFSGPRVHSTQVNFFLEDKFKISGTWSIIYGLRFANYFISNFYFGNFEPRISLEFNHRLGNFNIGYSKMSQPLHYLISNIEFPSEIWLPATRNLAPQLSDILSMGYSRKFYSDKILLHTEIFYKKLHNQVDFKNEVTPIFSLGNSNDWESILSGNGEGSIKGLEILLRYTDKKWDSWLAYTLSSNIRIDPKINNGIPYRQVFDRPHQLSVVNSYKINNALSLSTTVVAQSGNLFTIPSGLYSDFFGNIAPIYDRINNFRAPATFRLDMGINWNFETKKGNRSGWNFSVYNLFANSNINILEYKIVQGSDDKLLKSTLFGKSFFRAIPGVNYKYNFGGVNKEKYLIY